MANEATNEIFPMIGGDGPRSYAQNSSFQKTVIDSAKRLMIEAIKEKLDMKIICQDTSKTALFRIADLGCSTGPNTFLAVNNIIEAVQGKYETQLQNPSPPLDFQVFFNDCTDNDFNTLFKTLPSYNQKYFAAAVAGSFYTHLFPKSSLHFVHTSSSIHWLSKVPDQVMDRKSPAWNGGSIYCSGLSKQVTDAYTSQFKKDMERFLNARAEEIVGGGLMAILVPGLKDGMTMSQLRVGVIFHFLMSSLNDMAKLGAISEEKVESFNFPVYYSNSKEVEEIVSRNGHFSVERLETIDHPSPSLEKVDVKVPAWRARAAFEGILKHHFEVNEEIIDELFERLIKKLEDNTSVLHEFINRNYDLFILLKRKIN